MNNLHGLNPVQYGIETAVVVVVGLCCTILGIVALRNPRKTLGFRMKQWTKAKESKSAFVRFFMTFRTQPTLPETLLESVFVLGFGVFWLYLGSMGIGKLISNR
jgi:hypothetical protein